MQNHAFERYLKSNKIPYSLEDLYLVLKAVEDVFMAGYVREYSKSFKKTEFSKAKVYLFDTAYIHFLSREPEDYGRILENIVFIELFRRAENRERELNGLIAAMDHFDLDEGLILTYGKRETEVTMNKKKIFIIPVWKWLLVPYYSPPGKFCETRTEK